MTAEGKDEWSLHSIYCGHSLCDRVTKWSIGSGKHMDAGVSYAVISCWPPPRCPTQPVEGTICGPCSRWSISGAQRRSLKKHLPSAYTDDAAGRDFVPLGGRTKRRCQASIGRRRARDPRSTRRRRCFEHVRLDWTRLDTL